MTEWEKERDEAADQYDIFQGKIVTFKAGAEWEHKRTQKEINLLRRRMKINCTKEQIQELKWFCKNVTGTRKDFYDLFDQFNKFKKKLDRLNKTCELIKNHLNDKG